LEVVHFLAPGFGFRFELKTVCLTGGIRSIPTVQFFQKSENTASQSDLNTLALPVLRFCLLPVASYDSPVLPYAAKAVPEAFG
jgi:hypothetical protein